MARTDRGRATTSSDIRIFEFRTVVEPHRCPPRPLPRALAGARCARAPDVHRGGQGDEWVVQRFGRVRIVSARAELDSNSASRPKKTSSATERRCTVERIPGSSHSSDEDKHSEQCHRTSLRTYNLKQRHRAMVLALWNSGRHRGTAGTVKNRVEPGLPNCDW